MKHTKNYIFITLIVFSAYLIQRSLLFLTTDLDFEEIQKQSQTEGGVFGIDLSFSYLGMHIFWPFIIAFCIMALVNLKKDENFHPVFKQIESSTITRVIILIFIPILALFLHYLTIFPFFTESIDIAMMYGENQQGVQGPSFPKRIAHISIILLIILSMILSFKSIYQLIFKKSSS